MESYGSTEYCATLSHLGLPVRLAQSGGSMLARSIAGSSLTDLVGPYPWAGFADWSKIATDLDELTGHLTATLVVSPTAEVADATLSAQFPDHLTDFKSHYLVDLTTDHAAVWSPSHRRKMRRNRPELRVEALSTSLEIADRWVELYRHLRERHSVTGGAAFTDRGLRAQLYHPECRIFGAYVGGVIIGMVSFLRSGPVAAYHLGAYNPMGYAFEAAYAIFPAAFESLAAEGVELLNLGGGAGLNVDMDDGLARFKRGWSTHSGMARLAGRIMNQDAFDRLCGPAETSFWPPYRSRNTT